MSKYLVIVESPAKAKTIQKYLGKNFQVMACYGHVSDLVPKEGAVDPDDNFKMKYQIIEKNEKHVEAIRKALAKCDGLYLAPDPDREGEAIAWHLQQILKEKKALKGKTVSRIVFHQITKNAVQHALESPRDISMDLVHAQQARRALDYLVGFRISPLLWRKIRPGLSAGRVQSPALRLIVEREAEIEKFITQEYWTVHAALSSKEQPFTARLTHYQNEKLEQFSITDAKKSKSICDVLTKAANGKLTVSKITKKERKRYPAAPFTTSTLQQEASRKLGFSAQRTMQVAQQLYEGIDVGDGSVGLITYMRTDSVTLANEAIAEIRECIAQRYGKKNVPAEVRTYKTKAKNAQEAHEAIRPTSAFRIPQDIKSYLTPEQFKLYDLIWKRAVACQMIEATLDTVAVDFVVKDSVFRANGSTIVDPGFIAVYQEDVDDQKISDEEAEKMLPPLEEGQTVPVEAITGEQHFTEPPPRFTEASLVKALEEFGIGRPSTYASIIATLKYREYVEMDSKRFKPTDVGRIVNRFLTQYFTMYVDYNFTANLENELDAVACGEIEWIPVLETFWKPFIEKVEDVQENVKRSDVTQEKMDEQCPKCGKDLSIRLGKRGRFIGCTAYPECDYTRNLAENEAQAKADAELVAGRVCPDCQSPLIIRHGRYGKFIGCSGYPKCKYIEPLEKPEDTAVACPKCKEGHILKRRSRRGKIFYSCSRYPECDYALWYPPVSEPCPKCHWPMMMLKTTKRKGDEKMCPQKECGYIKKEPRA
ncbi:MAG: DNA topoisomerase I [Gammaproteobacteria bacterium RIFCSPLOWO2_02_FULL_42_14]|nr:MAG: DNA topoisomerase I [Gammaproteobacteria bacterium RIFCSPHIGHO2_02_FULL_42_43]OGT29104.1 MAG: DNA topoisomerase I [Gammaproteobacteria bacterium RIFCSPHIGHO2_01_FULL_42_8]OGT51335.1 MAG: DNA topoisomerase I [Gammaproteobacteria bacterium RIFCSPHIGHO2_12_FULL_41_25]OGT62037.1 MAG: DNA topoisomerase I [Gammaproteobacteria bacterium RIFCSPLOWO2_02_FULL_42_14]OGT85710.1 MAG: DNA topoisomerase I [Gammaproteobacteria bacterium RIFCSPLOWO2_12_FULL_42_18]